MRQSEKPTTPAKNSKVSSQWPLPFLFSEDLNESEIMQRLEGAIEKNHGNRMNCAERTLASIYQAFEFEKNTRLPEDVIRIASGFGGGGGVTSYGMCGAVSGGADGAGSFLGTGRSHGLFSYRGIAYNRGGG